MSAAFSPADLRARDTAARRRALTDLDSPLMVEAGAGSGKTSVWPGASSCSWRPAETVRNRRDHLHRSRGQRVAPHVEEFVADVLRGNTPIQLHLPGRTDRLPATSIAGGGSRGT